MEDYLQCLLDAVSRTLKTQERQWLNDALARIAGSAEPEDDLVLLSARAQRNLGSQSLPEEAGAIATKAGDVEIRLWTTAAAGRVALVLGAMLRHPDRARSLAQAVYRYGDEAEKAAIVQGLALLDDEGDLCELALDVGRTNSPLLFSALAARNPYPAAHYTEHQFNHLVLKMIFMGLSVDRIVGLGRRTNPMLSKMCEDYIEERRAAGRGFPGAIWLAVGPHASARGEALMTDYLEASDSEQRYYAAVSMGRRLPDRPHLRDALQARLNVEGDERVKSTLRSALS